MAQVSLTRLRRCFPGFALTAAVLSLLGSAAAPPAEAAKARATVTEILDGTEFFIEAKPAKVLQQATTPEVVSTKSSRGTLAFSNGAMARINRNSQFKLQSSCFLLTKGQVLISGPQNACIPSMKMAARGTNYVVEVMDDGTTQLSVLEGVVQLENTDPRKRGWINPIDRETVRISPTGEILDRRCMVSTDYKAVLKGPLFQGYEKPLPAFHNLSNLLSVNVPLPRAALSVLSFGLF